MRLTVAFLLACATVASAQTKRAFALSDWYRVTTLRQPALSPDGRTVAFTVTTVREAENKRHSEVWVVATDGSSAPRRLTSQTAESSTPRWTPDGKSLVVTAGGGLLRYVADDWSREPEKAERFQTGSMPNDRSFIVWNAPPDRAPSSSSAADRYASMGQSRPPFGAITRPADPKRFDGRQIVDFPFRANDQGYNAVRTRPREFIADQLFMQSTDGSPKRQLTATSYSHNNEAVSPDGKWIAFTADPMFRSDSVIAASADSIELLPYSEARISADRNDQDIFVISTTPCAGAAGCEPRRVARLVGNEASLAWSPDSRQISYVSRAGRFTQARLFVIDAGGGTPKNLTANWQYEPEAYFWRPDGSMVVTAAIGGRTAMFSLTTSGKLTEIVGGRRRMANFSGDAKNSRIAYVSTTVTAPTELYVVDADGKNERQLTRFNDALNNEVGWAEAERFTYRSVGNREIEGWLMKPFGYQSGRKYPLVLYIHGGPHSSYNEGWFDEFQNLAGAGFMVLYTNPRGSSGYGADFTYAIRGHWGEDDYLDLMKAVDLMAARPDVDSTRMGVTGGSYGGFMTGWITTKTRRFRAAEADRADMNWRSWYGGSDAAQGLTESELNGKPWEKGNIYDQASPIYYVDKVRTPTLIVHSEEDYRVTIGQGDEWFMSLKKQGVPVEFIRYPRSSHELSRSGEPWLLVDRLGRLRDWFTYWLIGGPSQSTGQR